MTDAIDITLAGKNWLYLHDRIVSQERTIADLQGYLHDAIKAYEALEAQTHHRPRRGPGCTSIPLKYQGESGFAEVVARPAPFNAGTTEYSFDSVVARKGWFMLPTDRRIGDLEEALGEAESSEKSLRARCHEQALDNEAQKHRIAELEDDLLLQRKINAQYQIEFAARDGRIAELERSLMVQKNWTDLYHRAWVGANDDVTLEEGTEAQRNRNAARQEQMDFKNIVGRHYDRAKDSMMGVVEPEGSGPFGF